MGALERARQGLQKYVQDPAGGAAGLVESVRDLRQLRTEVPEAPEVAHLLIDALLLLDDRRAVIELLKDFADHAPTVEEEFWARHNLVDQCSIAGRSAEAVDAHRHMLARLRGRLPAERLLWSLADGTMLGSWQREGAEQEWLARAESLFVEVPTADDTIPTRVQYLQLLNDALHVPHGDHDAARRTAGRILEIAAAAPAWEEGRWRSVEAHGTLLLVAEAELTAALQSGRRALARYEGEVRHGAGTPGFRHNFDHALRNFASVCLWSGQVQEATYWFRQLMDTGRPSAVSHVWLAECLAAQGDVAGAMAEVRAAAGDPTYGAFVKDLPGRDGLAPLRDRADFQQLIECHSARLADLRAAVAE